MQAIDEPLDIRSYFLLTMVSNSLGHDEKLSRMTFRSDLKEDRENFEYVYRKFLPSKGVSIKVLIWDMCKGNLHG